MLHTMEAPNGNTPPSIQTLMMIFTYVMSKKSPPLSLLKPSRTCFGRMKKKHENNTPQESNIDTKNCHLFKGELPFPNHQFWWYLQIQPFVFGECTTHRLIEFTPQTQPPWTTAPTSAASDLGIHHGKRVQVLPERHLRTHAFDLRTDEMVAFHLKHGQCLEFISSYL